MVLAAMGGGSSFGTGNSFSSTNRLPKLSPTPTPIFQNLPNNPNLPPSPAIFPSVPEKITQVLGAATTDPEKYFGSLFAAIPPLFWFALIIGLLILIIFTLALRVFLITWAQGAILASVAKEEQGEDLSLEKGSDYGRHHWKKLFHVSLTLWGLYFLGLLALSLFLGIGLIVSPDPLKILLALLAGLFALAVVIASLILVVWNALTNLVVTVEDYPVKEALAFSWQLTKKFFWQSVVLGLINQGIGCLYGLLSCLAILVIAGIFVGLGTLLLLIPVVGLSAVIFLVGIFISILCLTIITAGIVKAVTVTNWVLFYNDLKKEQNFPGQPELLIHNS